MKAAKAGESAAGERDPDSGQDRKARKLSPQQQVQAFTGRRCLTRATRSFRSVPQAANTPMYGIQGVGRYRYRAGFGAGNAFRRVCRPDAGSYCTTLEHGERALRCPRRNALSALRLRETVRSPTCKFLNPAGTICWTHRRRGPFWMPIHYRRLPPQFDRNDATVELWFQLKQ